MKNYRWLLSLALSLVLGLTSVVAAEHDHSEHANSACTLCLIQEIETVVGPDQRSTVVIATVVLFPSTNTLPTLCVGLTAYLARAPPQIA
tara:strand:+ start:219 stop:488 length:270 start_codon:yes stop_codon:yes gene_type:complete